MITDLKINKIANLGNNVKTMIQNENCTVLMMNDATGEGIMTVYQVMPGVMICFSDMHMEKCDSEFELQKDKKVLCIDHCREGRIEMEVQPGVFSIMQENELRLDNREKIKAVHAQITNHDIQLKNVHFSYTGEAKDEVLHGIDLDMPAGSYTALVGPSGGGKSTVAKLISRFWDVTGGEITIGGVNVKDMPLDQLSEMVSFVTQDNFLFRCSIMENIRLGNPSATDEQVKEAARKACCEEFIEKLPQGYDTPAGEAGKRLSGGEKQRIAIARIMLKNAPIVILDEATAFTDPENEDKLQRSIEELTKGKTLLVIAHRLSTITDADQIVVLKNGRIEAKGTQAQLLENCPLYERMWQAHVGARHWAVGGQKGGEPICSRQ